MCQPIESHQAICESPGRQTMVRYAVMNLRSGIVVPWRFLGQDLVDFRSDAPMAPHFVSCGGDIRADPVGIRHRGGILEQRCFGFVDQPATIGLVWSDHSRSVWQLEKAIFGLTKALRRCLLRSRQDLLDVGLVRGAADAGRVRALWWCMRAVRQLAPACR